MAETAPETADEGDTELEQPVGDRAGVHDVRGDDEQRHGEQHEAAVEAVHQNLACNAHALTAGGQINQRADDDGIGDRRADGS